MTSHGIHYLWEVWNKMDLMNCPIQIGAGVSIKVAKSLYHRMPVLATSRAIRGLACSAGEGREIIDSTDGWIAFLNSSRADQLVAETPSEKVSRQLSVGRHRTNVEQFLMEIALSVRRA